ncbi:hypothetical protein FOQG_00055 [Fusarium oxysporum f. sp. raphani 54005]|uniref:Uncharacterized protein n=1 Tax=Fusarium oxysporum f. sp. raphani 54005 TaxID=1089458 RepID=X0D8V4_FUSOX|nr:hypothetical protein FOQG_00055 [Fusarium oxysporum f. sp. raphani 54005]
MLPRYNLINAKVDSHGHIPCHQNICIRQSTLENWVTPTRRQQNISNESGLSAQYSTPNASLSQSQQDTDLPGLLSDLYLFKPRAQDSRPGPEPLSLFSDEAVIKILLSSVPNWCISVTGCGLPLTKSGSQVLLLFGNREYDLFVLEIFVRARPSPLKRNLSSGSLRLSKTQHGGATLAHTAVAVSFRSIMKNTRLAIIDGTGQEI